MHPPSKHRSKDLIRKRPLGVAVVELAVCLPVLAAILLVTIETCVMFQLQQNLSLTAYEGARIGIIPGSNDRLIDMQCKMLLDDRDIKGYSIATNPADPSTLSPGELLQVTVSASCGPNSAFGGLLYKDTTLSESVTLQAE